MRMAILGGSFNPIHLGHLFLADSVLSELHYDRVVLVPAYRSPFKLGAVGMETSARDRLQMIAASIAGDPRLTLDDCEIKREGVSYTIDTIKDIIKRYAPDGKPGLIIGDDLVTDFPKWNKSNEILVLADIIVARRVHADKLSLPYPAIQIANDVMEVSSSMLREKIASNGAWRFLLPPPARVIIENRKLYGCTGEAAAPLGDESPSKEGAPSAEEPIKNLILRVEEAARETLSIERFIHSRNVALLCWDLCRRFAAKYPVLVPQIGYLAGIAHDLGKPLSEKEMVKLIKNQGWEVASWEKDKPALLHGRASAALLKGQFNVNNEDVLEAVSLHTSGGESMGPLAKIVYIADKMEVSRERADPYIRKIVYSENDLDGIFAVVLNQNVSFLRSRKVDLSEETLRLLEKMEKLGGK